MAEPFNINEFRRQQIGAGQAPQGANPQGHMPAQPQYTPQTHPAQMQPPYPQQVPYQQMPPQGYAPHQQPQFQPPQPPHFAPPQSAEPVPANVKKSLFKRGPKAAKVKKTKASKGAGETRGRSPVIIFAAGLLTGIIGTVAGLTLMGNVLADKTDQKFEAIAAAMAEPENQSPLVMHEPQIAGEGEAPSRPLPTPVTP